MVTMKVKNTVRMKSVREKGEEASLLRICLYLQYSIVAVNAVDAYFGTHTSLVQVRRTFDYNHWDQQQYYEEGGKGCSGNSGS
jgi:hypothetical protein